MQGVEEINHVGVISVDHNMAGGRMSESQVPIKS